MKKIAVFMAAVIVGYSMYYDLAIGTLPSFSNPSSSSSAASPVPGEAPHAIVKINAGDTVISIVEELEKGTLPVPIEQVVEDFRSLNNQAKPEEIQIGKEYKFPIYGSPASENRR